MLLLLSAISHCGHCGHWLCNTVPVWLLLRNMDDGEQCIRSHPGVCSVSKYLRCGCGEQSDIYR
jgi:hypothetical protein